METNILIESGTNELEVLEFTIGNNHYGINVAIELIPIVARIMLINLIPNTE